MSRDFEIVDIPPYLEPLFRAVAACGISTRRVPQTVERLTQPPASLHRPTNDRTEAANSLLKTHFGSDENMAARMLRLDEGDPDSKATWKGLNRVERKRAKRKWNSVVDAGLDTEAQGRPPVIDSALVIYCARVIAEACGTQTFRFSRPSNGGAPYGPMWRALMLALPIASEFLASGSPPATTKAAHVETIAEIVVAARSSKFAAECRKLGLGPTANDVTHQPGSIRYALKAARRPPPRRKRPVP